MKKIVTGFACLFAMSSAFAQSTYSDWADAGKPALAPVEAHGGPGGVVAPTAALATFTDQASFLAAAAPGIPTETFNGGNTGSGGINTCTEPVSSASNDVCFAPGDLLPGFSITSSLGGGVVALGPTFLGANQTSTVVGANNFAEVTEIAFSPGVTAVGFDLVIGAPGPGDVQVTAFDGASAMITSVTVTTSAVDSTVFAGIVSPTPIASVTLTGVGGSGELMDNMYFGSAASDAEEIPTLGAYSMGLLIIGLLAMGAGLASRRRTA